MARAQSSLSRAQWRGADVGDLLREELSDQTTLRQLELSGPPLSLPAGSVQAFSMIVHELATNAIKYGALSEKNGRLSVVWRARPGNGWTFTWTERVERERAISAPQRRGFGTRLIERLASQIGARATFNWEPGGLRLELEQG